MTRAKRRHPADAAIDELQGWAQRWPANAKQKAAIDTLTEWLGGVAATPVTRRRAAKPEPPATKPARIRKETAKATAALQAAGMLDKAGRVPAPKPATTPKVQAAQETQDKATKALRAAHAAGDQPAHRAAMADYIESERALGAAIVEAHEA